MFRTVQPAGLADYRFVRDTKALDPLIESGAVLGAEEVDAGILGDEAPVGGVVLEHPRIPFWSYPYEWPFGALKAAALAHLDIQIELLDRDVALSDASAYNLQFAGARPVFTDALSFRRYRDNEHWAGYRQFREQFLNPLLLTANCGVYFQDAYRGRPEGVTAESVARLARWRHRLSLGMLLHVVAPARLEARADDRLHDRAVTARARGLPRSRYLGLLRQLRNWIAKLEPRDAGASRWGDYADNAPYGDVALSEKRALVHRFAQSVRPRLLLDLGCNTGEYAALALQAGAAKVVGLDADHGALEQAFARARQGGLDFLPLYQDCANPSPPQGWNAQEHRSLVQRCGAVDAVVALAFVHHLAISRNIPLPEIVRWITALAPRGLIEFVHQDDSTVARMLALREDVFGSYSFEVFLASLRSRARVVEHGAVSPSRELIWFETTRR